MYEGPYSGGVQRGTGAKAVERMTRDVYIGAYVDGKKQGQGMQLYLGDGDMQFSVYKGDWHSDHP